MRQHPTLDYPAPIGQKGLLSMPRLPQKKRSPKVESKQPIAITEAEVKSLIDQMAPFGERWDSAIDSTMRIFDAAWAMDKTTLQKLSKKGAKLQKRLSTAALVCVERNDLPGAPEGSSLALRYFFTFTHPYTTAKSSWIAERRSRVSGSEANANPSDAEPVGEERGDDSDELIEMGDLRFDVRHAVAGADRQTLDTTAGILKLKASVSEDTSGREDPDADPETERYIELLDSVGNEPSVRAKLMAILEAEAANDSPKKNLRKLRRLDPNAR